MTPGNNGASSPEDDDPFGYLYADGQANGAQPPSGGYGYPNSVSRVRTVGERQYGQQPPQQTAQYGQPTVPQQGAYGQPNAHHAAPGSGGASTGTRQQASGGGRGRGPNTKGLLIGAVAVVAAVVVGIAVVMSQGDSDPDDNQSGGQVSASSSVSASASPSESGGDEEAQEAELPTIDAKALRLGGTAALASDVQGAQAAGGIYVGNLNQVGNSVTWSVDGIPEDGSYTLFAHYSTAGEDQSMTLTINGKTFGSKFNLSNFAHAADGDFAKGWTETYAYPTLTKGTNTIQLSCQDGDKCNILLDQFRLKKGQVKE
ncbi:carbohydrate-binding protein [Streptomyces sp. NPDC017936]|uniref:carbohydrate-binding protein n=1 Tax=Streptomyces sp. NPDC017936 TaxID=3365016 RepID=UPI00379E4C68